MEWRESTDAPDTPSSSQKKHGLITNVTITSSIEIQLLQPPNTLTIQLQRRIGPLRHSTVINVPELVLTANRVTIIPEQISNVITVFHPNDIINGEVGISGMVNYYILRNSIDMQQQLTSHTAFSPFVSDYIEYTTRFGIFADISRELHELRLELKEIMQSIMCNSGTKQGSGSSCHQRKIYVSFGVRKWNLLLYLFQKYAEAGFIPKVHVSKKNQRKTVLKPTLAVSGVTVERMSETVFFLYPQDFKLLMSLFGEMFLRGVRKRRPRIGVEDIQLADGFILNKLVCNYTIEEGVRYYQMGCEWPGVDPTPAHYLKFMFDGERKLIVVVHYCSVTVQRDMIHDLKKSQLELPEGNILESDMLLPMNPRVRVGLMFSVPLEEEEYPYNAFGEVAYKIVEINNRAVVAVVLDPPSARERLPDHRQFTLDDITRYIPH